MAATYTSIATTTASGSTTTITFSSISSAYTDLVLVIAGNQSSAGQVDFRVGNGSIDSGSNYSTTSLYGDGSTAGSLRYSGATQINIGYSDTSQNNTIVHLMNYSNTTTYKTVLSRSAAAATATSARVGLWRSTSAINTISIIGGNNWSSTTTFTLYGIKSA